MDDEDKDKSEVNECCNRQLRGVVDVSISKFERKYGKVKYTPKGLKKFKENGFNMDPRLNEIMSNEDKDMMIKIILKEKERDRDRDRGGIDNE